MNIDLVKCIQHLRPNEEWALAGSEYSGLVWHSTTPKPTEEELLSVWGEIQPKLKWGPIRLKRNSLLASSDWTQFNDVNLVDKQGWIEYRQKLRDITKDFSTPEDVIWPVPPA